MSSNKGQKVERDRLIFDGIVVDSANSQFRVKVSEGYEVLCSLSGKIRQNGIRILQGDAVQIEVSEFDPVRGRITYRLK